MPAFRKNPAVIFGDGGGAPQVGRAAYGTAEEEEKRYFKTEKERRSM